MMDKRNVYVCCEFFQENSAGLVIKEYGRKAVQWTVAIKI